MAARECVPADAKILVEPSQNTPPMGSYLTATNFYRDYVLVGRDNAAARPSASATTTTICSRSTPTCTSMRTAIDDEEKRRYIASRLAQVDWIVIDDTYVQWYQHLPPCRRTPSSSSTTGIFRREARVCAGQDLQGLSVAVRRRRSTTTRRS